jgi:hypothetical protein
LVSATPAIAATPSNPAPIITADNNRERTSLVSTTFLLE